MKKYHTIPETKKQLFTNVEEKEIIEEKPNKLETVIKKVVKKKIKKAMK